MKLLTANVMFTFYTYMHSVFGTCNLCQSPCFSVCLVIIFIFSDLDQTSCVFRYFSPDDVLFGITIIVTSSVKKRDGIGKTYMDGLIKKLERS